MVKEKILNQTFDNIYNQRNYTENISYTLPDEKYKLKRKKKPFKPSGIFKDKYYEFKSSNSALNLSENNIDQKHAKKQFIETKPNFYTSPTKKGYSNCPGLTFGRFPEYIPSQYKAISEQQIYRTQQKQYKTKKKPFKPCIKMPGNFNKFWKSFNPNKSFAVIQQQMKRTQSEHLPPFFPAKRPKSKFGRYPEWMPGKNIQEEKKEQLSQQVPQRVRKKKAWKYSGKGTYQLPFTVIANDIRNLRKENLAPRNHFSINVKQ